MKNGLLFFNTEEEHYEWIVEQMKDKIEEMKIGGKAARPLSPQSRPAA